MSQSPKQTVAKGLDLKIARLRAGLRQYEVAARVGVTATKLCEIEGGRRSPSPELLERILAVIQGGHDGKRKQQT